MRIPELPNAHIFLDSYGTEHRINIYKVFGAYLFLSNRVKLKFTYEGAVTYYSEWLEGVYEL